MSNSFISTYQNELIACVDNAVIEDLGKMGDHTSKAIFPKGHTSKAQLVSRGDGVLAGVAFCEFVLQRHGQGVSLSPSMRMGLLVTATFETDRHVFDARRIKRAN